MDRRINYGRILDQRFVIDLNRKILHSSQYIEKMIFGRPLKDKSDSLLVSKLVPKVPEVTKESRKKRLETEDSKRVRK